MGSTSHSSLEFGNRSSRLNLRQLLQGARGPRKGADRQEAVGDRTSRQKMHADFAEVSFSGVAPSASAPEFFDLVRPAGFSPAGSEGRRELRRMHSTADLRRTLSRRNSRREVPRFGPYDPLPDLKKRSWDTAPSVMLCRTLTNLLSRFV